MPTVLVVDDDRAVQDLLVDLLGERGYAVRTARDGKQAVAEVEREAPDLIVLDVLIPHMNGFAVMEQIRGQPHLRDIPVIMVSGIYRSRNHRADMTTRYNVIEYLDKPLNTARLLDLVDRVLKPGSATDPVEAPVPLDKPKPPVELVQRKEPPPQEDQVRDEDLLDEVAALAPPPAKLSAESSAQFDARLIDLDTKHEQQMVESEARESFRTSAFVLQGSIKKTPVVAVLGKLWDERVSGALLLRRNKVKKIVYIERGNPVSVKSNLINECLGKILMRERLITRDECETSIERMKKSSQKQGEILVEMGCLTQKNLTFALELQLETKLFETFAWEDGEYRFNSSVPLAPVDQRLDASGAAIVVEGIRRTFDETRLRRLMVPVLDVPLVFGTGPYDLPGMHFSAREQQVIESIIPPQTTRALLDSLPLDPVDNLRVAYTLIALEILRPAG